MSALGDRALNDEAREILNAETGTRSWRKRIAEGRPLHGLGPSTYLPGNVQHLVSPLVGMLRLQEADGETPDAEDVDAEPVDAVMLILDVADEIRAFLAGEPA